MLSKKIAKPATGKPIQSFLALKHLAGSMPANALEASLWESLIGRRYGAVRHADLVQKQPGAAS